MGRLIAHLVRRGVEAATTLRVERVVIIAIRLSVIHVGVNIRFQYLNCKKVLNSIATGSDEK